MDYIYTRVSTAEQSTEAQELKLKSRYPSATVVSEKASGMKDRPALAKLISQLQTSDRLIVAALDRLGRKTTEILKLIEDLSSRQITLISDREGLDYSTPMGRLVTQILVSVSELERSMISERTKAGVANAKAKGKQVGAKPLNQNRKGKYKIYPAAFIERFQRLSKALTPKEIAVEMNLSLSSVYDLRRRYV